MSSRPLDLYEHAWHVSRADYDAMVAAGVLIGKRVELIEGVIVHMAPQEPPHSGVIEALTHELVLQVGRRARVRVQLPFLAFGDSEPEPDLAVVPIGPWNRTHPDRAHLLIEVAWSSQKFDGGKKVALYAQSGVPEYWLVDAKARKIRVYTQPVGDDYTVVRTFGEHEQVAMTAFPDVVIAVDAALG